MVKPYTEQDFITKIELEGGVLDALEYGLRPEDVEPGELQEAWRALRLGWDELQWDLQVVERILADLEKGEVQ